MGFRHISELAGDVVRRLEIEASNRGSDERAPARSAATDLVATGHGEGAKPVAFAQSGGRSPAEQTELGKMGEPKPPRVVQGGGQSKDRRANKGHSSTLRLIYSSKCLDTAKPTQRPTAVVSRHLRLVVSH